MSSDDPTPPASAPAAGLITTLPALHSYLSTHHPSLKYTSITPLTETDGNTNYLFRLHLHPSISLSDLFPSSPNEGGKGEEEKEKEKGGALIIKHAAPFSRRNNSVSIDAGRMDAEVSALSSFSTSPFSSTTEADNGEKGNPSVLVTTPRIYFYSPTHHVLFMSDGGATTLKRAYTDLSPLQAREIGGALGGWLHALHSSTTISGDESGSGKEGERDGGEARDAGIAAWAFRYVYSQLPASIARFGPDDAESALTKRVEKLVEDVLATEPPMVPTTTTSATESKGKEKRGVRCMGDFWPGNMLLSSHPNPDGDAVRGKGANEGAAVVTIVDWEVTHSPAVPATDLAQFAAEAYLLGRFHGEKALLSSFLRAYRSSFNAEKEGEEVKVDVGEMNQRRLYLHFGAHLLVWAPYAMWGGGGDEALRPVVEAGKRALEVAVSGDTGAGWLGEFVAGG